MQSPFASVLACEDVLVGRDEEARGAAGRVKDGFVLLRVNNLNHEVDDVARGAELSRIALRTEHTEQIFKCIAQPLAVVVAELVNDLEKASQGLRVTIGQVGVFEDVAEEQRDAGVLRHIGDGLGIEVEGFVAAKAGAHEFGPAVAGEVAGEKLALAAEFLGLGVHVVHELVDQGNGDLLDLRFGVGYFAHKNVTGGVDAAFGIGVQH